MNNKKGFSLAEALTTLTILGVLAAILFPVINSARPDKDKVFFKKGVYTLQTALAQVLRENRGVLQDAGNTAFLCEQMSNEINTMGNINCGASSYANPNFISNDGVRFWGLEQAFNSDTLIAGRNSIAVYIDRNLTASEEERLASGKLRGAAKTTEGLRIYINEKGKTSIQPDDAYEFGLIDVLSITK